VKKDYNEIKRVSDGDEISFEHLMMNYSSSLFRYTMGIIHNRESSEEIVSDVFLEVWESRKNLLAIGNFKAWLYTIAYHKTISYLRSIPKAEEVSYELIEDFKMSPIESPDEEIINKEEIEAINKAIQKLPPKCKHVFYLAKIEKIPYKEISRILNISVKTINNHIAYAMAKIKDCLE
jgi:RNA polymerase sigma-70 factor (family 1)